MEIKEALKEQYHGGLAMLAECVEKCPEDLWLQGRHPRAFWRIAAHATYFAHNYLVQSMEEFNSSFTEWPAAIRKKLTLKEDQQAVDVEPYELPEGVDPLTRKEILDYINYVRALIDSTIDKVDLDADQTGFPWYPDMSKLSHELMSVRHIQGHVGQLSELLMARGIDTGWIAKSSAKQ